MQKYDLLSEILRRRKWQQIGKQIHRYENLLNREFHADRLNSMGELISRDLLLYVSPCFIMFTNWSSAGFSFSEE